MNKTKSIIGSIFVIGVIAVMMGAGTQAYFSDTETSTDNYFTAGVIDLEIDCAGDTTFSAQDGPLPEIFEYLPANDIKPGDDGEVTLSFHLKDGSNNADLWMKIINLVDDGGLNPESEEAGDDVISDAIEVLLWLEMDGDNIYEPAPAPEDEILLHDGTIASLAAAGELTVKDDAVACTIYYVGFYWELPITVGNEAQGDQCTFDIVFGADQLGMP